VDEAFLSDELVLDENAVLVPVNYFRGDFEAHEEPDVSPEPYVAGTKQNLSLLTADNIVQTRSDVKVDSRQINFAKVPRVVHVS
jgi:hypothetical protein